MPTVGIGIPVYNGEKYLSQAIASALDQTELADEILVFVHDSSDQSLEIAHSFSVNHDRVRIVEDNSNLSIGQAWQAIYQYSDCDYVVMLHADDLLYPHTIQTLRAAISSDPDAGCIYGITNAISETGTILCTNFAPDYIPRDNSDYLDKALTEYFLPGCPGICAKRAVILAVPFLTNLNILLDIEWSIRIAWSTKVLGLPNILSAYRLHQLSTFRTVIEIDQINPCTQDVMTWWDLFDSGSIAVPENLLRDYRNFLFKKIINLFLIDLYSKNFAQVGTLWTDFLQPIRSKHPDLYQHCLHPAISFICKLACSNKLGYQIASLIYRPIHISKYAPQVIKQKLSQVVTSFNKINIGTN